MSSSGNGPKSSDADAPPGSHDRRADSSPDETPQSEPAPQSDARRDDAADATVSLDGARPDDAVRDAVVLVVHERSGTRRRSLNVGARLVIGRRPSDDADDGTGDDVETLVVEGPLTSRRHAEIRVDDAGDVHVRDLDSRYGVLLDGERIAEGGAQRVPQGVTLEIGDAEVDIGHVDRTGDAAESATADPAMAVPSGASRAADDGGELERRPSGVEAGTDAEPDARQRTRDSGSEAVAGADETREPTSASVEVGGAEATTGRAAGTTTTERDAGARGADAVLAERAGLPHAPTASLAVYVEQGRGRDARLSLRATDSRQLVIGRGHDVDVTLDDTTASRHHCRLEVDADPAELQDGDVGSLADRKHTAPRFRIVDLESRGGTWLNGQRITAPTPLAHGDVVGIGRHQGRVVLVERDAAAESADVETTGESDDAERPDTQVGTDEGGRVEAPAEGRAPAREVARPPQLRLVLRRRDVHIAAVAASGDGASGTTLHHVDSGHGSERSRAPSWVPTSDLERPRRWPWAVGAAVAVLLAGMLVELVAPGLGVALTENAGPLARPHQTAELECADCHDPPPETAALGPEGVAPEHSAACQGCHGPRTSVRPGHASAAAEGALVCADCHRVHDRMEGIELAADGSGDWLWWRTGADDVHGRNPRFALPDTPDLDDQRVVLVPLQPCTRCHDAGQALDPIHRCIEPTLVSPSALARAHEAATPGATVDTQEEPASLEHAYAFCFAEHQRPGEPQALGPQHNIGRAAAWSAARQIVASELDRAPEPRRETQATLWWIAAAVLLPLGLLAAGRRWLWHDGDDVADSSAAVAVSDPSIARRGDAASDDDDLVSVGLAAGGKKVIPRVDALTCLGCSACIDACPYDVLALEDYVARVVREDLCCGVGACEEKCPNGSLVLDIEQVDLDGLVDRDTPPVSLTLESELRRGVYVAGDLTGVPLIKNAINQGARAVDAIADDLETAGRGPASTRRSSPAGDTSASADGDATLVDVLIVGAGPSGLSAALACHRHDLDYRLIDQGEAAQSIKNFPRGKLVFDQPMHLPVVGDLWLEEASKEELLRHWERIIRDEEVAIDAFTRLDDLDGGPIGHTSARSSTDAAAESTRSTRADGRRASGSSSTDAFVARCTDPRTGEPRSPIHARRVVVCIGRRGSPRKLPIEIPPEAESHVHYSLADARSFAGKRVVIVGLGDVAMEAAVALANQPGTRVTISYRRPGFHSGSRRNQRAVDELIKAGLIDVHWSTEVSRIERGRVWLRSNRDGEPRPAADAHGTDIASAREQTDTPDRGRESTDDLSEISIYCDAVLVMIGGIPPRSLLRELGLVSA